MQADWVRNILISLNFLHSKGPFYFTIQSILWKNLYTYHGSIIKWRLAWRYGSRRCIKPHFSRTWLIYGPSREKELYRNCETYPPWSACAVCAGWPGSKLFTIGRFSVYLVIILPNWNCHFEIIKRIRLCLLCSLLTILSRSSNKVPFCVIGHIYKTMAPLKLLFYLASPQYIISWVGQTLCYMAVNFHLSWTEKKKKKWLLYCNKLSFSKINFFSTSHNYSCLSS